jgi:TatA/E family protein of Tat protein translocase
LNARRTISQRERLLARAIMSLTLTEENSMGTLGWQETVAIFVLALLLFGPKKLPELGRTIGKALTEFRRASNELKSTFDRQMKELEQETAPIKEAVAEYQYDTYNYGDSSGTPYDHSYEAGESDFAASHPSIAGASAPLGAESTSSVSPEGTVAYGVAPQAGVASQTGVAPETGVNPEAADTSSGQTGALAPQHAASAEHSVPVPTTEHQA